MTRPSPSPTRRGGERQFAGYVVIHAVSVFVPLPCLDDGGDVRRVPAIHSLSRLIVVQSFLILPSRRPIMALLPHPPSPLLGVELRTSSRSAVLNDSAPLYGLVAVVLAGC